MPLIGQKFGFQFYFLISSLRSNLNSISFNHAAEGQHEHIILVISFYIEHTNSLSSMFLIKFTASYTFFASLAIRVDLLLKKIQLNFEKMCFCGFKNLLLVLYDSEAISL